MMQDSQNATIPFTGYVEPHFEEVEELFRAHFERGLKIGAAVAVCHKGKLVVDLAGGTRDRNSIEPYSLETLQPVFSVSKGMTALVANMLADRGQLDLDVPVARYWPEFAQADKSDMPVRWLLTHQSGVLALDSRR